MRVLFLREGFDQENSLTALQSQEEGGKALFSEKGNAQGHSDLLHHTLPSFLFKISLFSI